jgi:hypothetical protein
MDKQDPDKDPKQQSTEGYQPPPQEIVRKVTEQQRDEQAGLQGYSVPGTGESFIESAAAPEV